MRLKDTQELLEIWSKNDRSEWSGEAFEAIRVLLSERLESVPVQGEKPNTRNLRIRHKGNSKVPVTVWLIFSPFVPVFILLLLGSIIHLTSDDSWFGVLLFLFMALAFFVPGIWLGWQGWFQANATKKQISQNLPQTKAAMGILYHFYTYFLPDRYVPSYFLFAIRFMSVGLIMAGFGSLALLIHVI